MGGRNAFRWSRRMSTAQLRRGMVSMFEAFGDERALVHQRDDARKRVAELEVSCDALASERDAAKALAEQCSALSRGMLSEQNDARAFAKQQTARIVGLEAFVEQLQTVIKDMREQHAEAARNSRVQVERMLSDNSALGAVVVEQRERLAKVRDVRDQLRTQNERVEWLDRRRLNDPLSANGRSISRSRTPMKQACSEEKACCPKKGLAKREVVR